MYIYICIYIYINVYMCIYIYIFMTDMFGLEERWPCTTRNAKNATHSPAGGVNEFREQWLQRHPEAGSSWPSLPKAA